MCIYFNEFVLIKELFTNNLGRQELLYDLFRSCIDFYD